MFFLFIYKGRINVIRRDKEGINTHDEQKCTVRHVIPLGGRGRGGNLPGAVGRVVWLGVI